MNTEEQRRHGQAVHLQYLYLLAQQSKPREAKEPKRETRFPAKKLENKSCTTQAF
jgi:hypothetical protein